LGLVYLDLAELDTALSDGWLWSTRHRALLEFRRRDHWGPPDEPLWQTVAKWVETQLQRPVTGPIRLLTQVRHWGYVFNPVSFFFGFADTASREPDWIVAEVNNTPWKQRHCYLLEPRHFAHKLRGEATAKTFHVSPFMDMAMNYLWHITPPGERVSVDMVNQRGDERLFEVTMQLARQPLSRRRLASWLYRYPLATFSVTTQIYWHALRLWLKGVPFVPHPAKGLPHGNQTPGSKHPISQGERT
jgi:hypothetical protein